MKHVALCLIVFLAFCACEQNPGVQNQEFDTGVLSIQMDAEKIPNEVAKLSGSLTREDFDPIEFDFEVNENSASILIENIAEGVWTIKIDAFNINGMIIYTASKEVLVVANQVTPVHIHLMKTGSVQIIITWPDDPGNVSDDHIYIPDKNLLNALIEEGVDTNGDKMISIAEARAVNSLVMRSKNISDLTGIEKFINLDTLDCSYNRYPSIDVSKMPGLIYLDCSESHLEGLDVTNNPLLSHLDCSDYRIPSLDVSKNPYLTYLNCHNNLLTSIDLTNNLMLETLFIIENQLTTLDISNNTALTWIGCGNNRITTLDISNNNLIKTLGVDYMPSLTKVCVWTIPFPPEGVEVYDYGSPNFYFTTDCSQ